RPAVAWLRPHARHVAPIAAHYRADAAAGRPPRVLAGPAIAGGLVHLVGAEDAQWRLASEHVDTVAERCGGETAASGGQREAARPAARRWIVDLDGPELRPDERRAPADRPELALERDRREMIASGRHRRRVGPAVGCRLVHLVRGAGTVAAAADRVQSAAEGDHRERAARVPERRAGGPRASCLIVLVDRPKRRPAHAAAAEAANHEQAAVDDGG